MITRPTRSFKSRNSQRQIILMIKTKLPILVLAQPEWYMGKMTHKLFKNYALNQRNVFWYMMIYISTNKLKRLQSPNASC